MQSDLLHHHQFHLSDIASGLKLYRLQLTRHVYRLSLVSVSKSPYASPSVSSLRRTVCVTANAVMLYSRERRQTVNYTGLVIALTSGTILWASFNPHLTHPPLKTGLYPMKAGKFYPFRPT
ncbi:hypothetical protein PoB_003759800 [Plakobranchus ocellatus]|uniref:Uncharacterized protein n=1 Tax=Plakobranchus ocellatus TaxID=259542 RepID=A0AAV4AUM1_9GAST|nr:hypothetical protein PoB_003759800 [Plakobranchus ocellatus]